MGLRRGQAVEETVKISHRSEPTTTIEATGQTLPSNHITATALRSTRGAIQWMPKTWLMQIGPTPVRHVMMARRRRPVGASDAGVVAVILDTPGSCIEGDNWLEPAVSP
jgi:hypothetical protein